VTSIIGAAVLGSFIADTSWYWIARRHGRRVLSLLCKVSLSPDSCVRQTESLYVKVGPAVLLFAKFIPGLGGVAIALSGITRVRPAVFISFELVGASLYLSLPVLLGWTFHDAVTNILDRLAQLGLIGLAIIVGALALYLFLRWWERMLFIRQLRMDRITVDELVALLDNEKKPILLDVRSRQARAAGVIPGAVAAHPEDMHPTLEHHDRDAEIVVYCACPNEATAALAAKHLKKLGSRRSGPCWVGWRPGRKRDTSWLLWKTIFRSVAADQLAPTMANRAVPRSCLRLRRSLDSSAWLRTSATSAISILVWTVMGISLGCRLPSGVEIGLSGNGACLVNSKYILPKMEIALAGS